MPQTAKTPSYPLPGRFFRILVETSRLASLVLVGADEANLPSLPTICAGIVLRRFGGSNVDGCRQMAKKTTITKRTKLIHETMQAHADELHLAHQEAPDGMLFVVADHPRRIKEFTVRRDRELRVILCPDSKQIILGFPHEGSGIPLPQPGGRTVLVLTGRDWIDSVTLVTINGGAK